MKALIVGGGIGGLSCALALRRRGWQVGVLERAAEFTEVGAGLSLWPNALRALDALGLGEPVRGRATLAGQGGIQDAAGRWLSRTDTAELDRRYGPMAMIHRADLLALLRAAVTGPAGAGPEDAAGPGVSLRGGVTVRAVEADGTVLHSAGRSRADLIVGADGIHSVVRRSLWPGSPAPRYAGYTAWRMVTPPVPLGESSESWGAGERFGYVALADGRIYCYATANAPEGAEDGGLAGMRRRFGGWHQPIPALLEAADPDTVLHNDLYDLPPLAMFVSGRAALVGDAAHAMTPNLGQGACQALEDAVVLARSVGRGAERDTGSPGDLEAGLRAYDRLRRPRSQMIAARSRQIGVVAQWQSPLAVRLRDTALRLLPGSALARSLAPVLDWTA